MANGRKAKAPRPKSKARTKATDSKDEAKAAQNAKPAPEPANDDKRDPATGEFLPGHRFWRTRASSGPEPLFAEAESLWAACDSYFCWVEDNPIMVDGALKWRPMTKKGLCRFLGIAHTTWAEWKRDRAELASVIERAESVIWDQKFAGAAVGIFNGNLVARELGIAERVAGHDGGPVEVKDLTPQRPSEERLLVMLRPFLGPSPEESLKAAKALTEKKRDAPPPR
jgi:DNA-packaging protein gp3